MPDRRPLTAIGEVFCRYIWPAPQSDSLTEPFDSEKSEFFAKNLEELRWCINLVRSRNARLIVLHTPNRDEVANGDRPRDTQYERYRPAFISFCSEQGVDLVNLVAEWRDRPEAARFFRDGVHPSPTGYRAIAERLVTELAKP
jgi:lysophospholipase L1-like esterase